MTARNDSSVWETVAEIDPRGALPAYVQLAAILRSLIIARKMPVGTPLQSEPELAERYGISRSTVRRAIKVLDYDLAMIESRAGIGHHVSFCPPVETIEVSRGVKITGRYPQPKERHIGAQGHNGMSTFTVLVVEEPGKEPVLYDATRTEIVTA